MSSMKENILNGYSIVIYPEGGWKDENSNHPYDIKPNELLNQFRNGAFRLAINTNTDIIPVSMCNAKNIHSSDTMLFKPGKVILCIHKPIKSQNFLNDETKIIVTKQNIKKIIPLIKVLTNKRKAIIIKTKIISLYKLISASKYL